MAPFPPFRREYFDQVKGWFVQCPLTRDCNEIIPIAVLCTKTENAGGVFQKCPLCQVFRWVSEQVVTNLMRGAVPPQNIAVLRQQQQGLPTFPGYPTNSLIASDSFYERYDPRSDPLANSDLDPAFLASAQTGPPPATQVRPSPEQTSPATPSIQRVPGGTFGFLVNGKHGNASPSLQSNQGKSRSEKKCVCGRFAQAQGCPKCKPCCLEGNRDCNAKTHNTARKTHSSTSGVSAPAGFHTAPKVPYTDPVPSPQPSTVQSIGSLTALNHSVTVGSTPTPVQLRRYDQATELRDRRLTSLNKMRSYQVATKNAIILYLWLANDTEAIRIVWQDIPTFPFVTLTDCQEFIEMIEAGTPSIKIYDHLSSRWEHHNLRTTFQATSREVFLIRLAETSPSYLTGVDDLINVHFRRKEALLHLSPKKNQSLRLAKTRPRSSDEDDLLPSSKKARLVSIEPFELPSVTPIPYDTSFLNDDDTDNDSTAPTTPPLGIVFDHPIEPVSASLHSASLTAADASAIAANDAIAAQMFKDKKVWVTCTKQFPSKLFACDVAQAIQWINGKHHQDIGASKEQRYQHVFGTSWAAQKTTCSEDASWERWFMEGLAEQFIWL
ncbi:hypothetical protein DL96DRAFT_1596018 [Flagelloscypha sp. PMI_526]|nr:hypothetical protein DL96DRAFT_1596018 [Flagelloscypha sp. PMI_526]